MSEKESVYLSDNEMIALQLSDPETAMHVVAAQVEEVVKSMEESVDSLDDLDEEEKNLYVLLNTMIYMYNNYINVQRH